MRWVYYILPFFIFLLACQKEIIGGESAGFAQVRFYTDYAYVAGVNVYVKSWEPSPVYYKDSVFTKLIFRDSEPSCDDTAFKVLHAAKGRYYSIFYRDEDAETDIDTAFMIPEYNDDECVFINLNN